MILVTATRLVLEAGLERIIGLFFILGLFVSCYRRDLGVLMAVSELIVFE